MIIVDIYLLHSTIECTLWFHRENLESELGLYQSTSFESSPSAHKQSQSYSLSSSSLSNLHNSRSSQYNLWNSLLNCLCRRSKTEVCHQSKICSENSHFPSRFNSTLQVRTTELFGDESLYTIYLVAIVYLFVGWNISIMCFVLCTMASKCVIEELHEEIERVRNKGRSIPIVVHLLDRWRNSRFPHFFHLKSYQ